MKAIFTNSMLLTVAQAIEVILRVPETLPGKISCCLSKEVGVIVSSVESTINAVVVALMQLSYQILIIL